MIPVGRSKPYDIAERVQNACRAVANSVAEAAHSSLQLFPHSAVALSQDDTPGCVEAYKRAEAALAALYKELPLLKESSEKLTPRMRKKFEEHFSKKYTDIFDKIMSRFFDRAKNLSPSYLNAGFFYLLQEAVKKCGDEEVLNHIIQYYYEKHRGSLLASDPDGNTFCLNAARFGKNSAIEKLVELGVDIKVSNNRKHNALQIASFAQQPATIRLLLEKYQFDVDGSESADNQPIFLAAAGEMAVESMQVLLSHNAYIYHQTRQLGLTVMQQCCLHSRPEAVRLLCQQDDALRARGEGAAKRLVDTPDYDGSPPLNYVARNTDTTIAKILIEHGADIYCLDFFRGNLLHNALEAKNVNFLSLICQKDLEYSQAGGHSRPRLANTYDNDGYTPCQRLLVMLSMASPDDVENIESIEDMLEILLVEGGADLSLRPCRRIVEHAPISDMQNALVSHTLSRVADRIEVRQRAAYEVLAVVCTLAEMQARRFEMQALRAALQLCQFVSNAAEGLTACVEHYRQTRDSAQ